MRVPAAGQVRRDAPRAFEIALLLEEMPDHRRKLANLHVLEKQLTVQPFHGRLRLGWSQGARGIARSARWPSQNALLFRGGVASKRLVEVSDRIARCRGLAGLSRGQESAEEVVQVPMLLRQGGCQEGRTEGSHRLDFFTVGREWLHVFAPSRPVAWLVLALFFSAACGEKADPVRQTLDRLVRAAQARDREAVLENVTADFRDAGGGGFGDARETLRRFFAAYEIINVRMRDLTIERAPEAARARFRMEFSGQPRKIGGLDALLPSVSACDFDVRLVPDGRRWKIAWASWEVVGDR